MERQPTAKPREERKADYFFYFPTESGARDAAKELQKYDFSISVRAPEEEGDRWFTKATGPVIDEPEVFSALETMFYALAQLFDGEYDGWEADA